jgi:hypothetical protein
MMARSQMQELFLREYAATFEATRARLVERLATGTSADAAAIVQDELQGLYHGLLVIFDGGTSLANEGLVSIVDEDGVAFDRHLHEICFGFWPVKRA